MTKSRNDHIAELQTSGLKATLPRLKVLEVFQRETASHLSAEDIYRHLIAEDADIGLATVYRVLAQFEQAGLLKRTQFEGGRAVFEVDHGKHHDHLVCVACGRIEEFVDAEIEQRQHAIARERGFELREHVLALYGRCSRPECQAN
ncbi:ferric iron uptake transcriptional regulator [Azohydromonas lata]|uniref:Ferric uptake regulation protein n=1 Tax=Azohydromonas lata TaxID=45677 RepID=A0ABU5IMZ1_9BURK|nr:ferric iron uptake transcriptional regulator [Azohydromonas lata]MDZ5460271.1 ferric iron uptake transcriptional regulator [Azohydromonas lata]